MRKLNNIKKEKKASLEEITRSCRCRYYECTGTNSQTWQGIQLQCELEGRTNCPF